MAAKRKPPHFVFVSSSQDVTPTSSASLNLLRGTVMKRWVPRATPGWLTPLHPARSVAGKKGVTALRKAREGIWLRDRAFRVFMREHVIVWTGRSRQLERD